MVLADHVYQDRQTGKFIIAGTFGSIFFGKRKVIEPKEERPSEVAGQRQTFAGPLTQIGSPYLYLALAEVQGKVPLTIRFVDLSDANVLFETQLTVTSADPVATAEYVVPMPSLPASKVGSFSLDLLYDGEMLGSWRVTVKKIEQGPSEPGAAP